MSDLLPWCMGIYTLYDCINAGYINILVSIRNKGDSIVGYKMVYIHTDESDWPYLLSHNAPASNRSLSDHLEDVWGPGGITQSNAPLGMHASLHRVLEMWHLFFQVLMDLRLGENMPFELVHEQFLEAIKDDLSMVRLHGNVVPKPANPQWQNNAFTLWAQCLRGSGRNIVGSVIYT